MIRQRIHAQSCFLAWVLYGRLKTSGRGCPGLGEDLVEAARQLEKGGCEGWRCDKAC